MTVQPVEDIYQGAISEALSHRLAVLSHALGVLSMPGGPLASAAHALVDSLRSGHKILAAGNGGSAAEAQHFTAELVGRFQRDREPYAALALTTDTSALTAIANDYGYADVFARQVRALGSEGDALVLFSTSGESENVLRAAEAARERGIAVIAIVGGRPSTLERLADITVQAPVADTPIAQEIHMMITHVLCGVVEEEMCRP